MRHLGAVSPSSLQPRSPSSNDLQVNLAPRLRRPLVCCEGIGLPFLGASPDLLQLSWRAGRS